MPRRTGQQRVSAYDIKKTTSMPPAYEARVGKADVAVFGVLADLEAKCAGILTDADVTGSDRIKYLNFVRAVWSQVRKGTLTNSKKNALVTYFVSQGCDEAVLTQLANAVMGATT
ncbi:hypothetical protein KEJ27_09840 [Candidatus Bathyarchaeota archaeon]|nr:hypothetical protein [Candidatus Bathyarchaeota archaeon]